MSAVPPPYIPASSFGTIAQQPISTRGLPGSELDVEFSNAAATINAVRSRLSQIQRDDGELGSGVVTADSIDPALLMLFLTGQVNLRGIWQPNTPYTFTDSLADVYVYQGTTRIVANTYTSGASFGSADTENTGVLGAPPTVGNITRNIFTGNGTTRAFTLTVTPFTDTNLHIYVNGLLADPASYTLDGQVITFTTAPASAALIIAESGIVNQIDITTVADGAIVEAKLGDGAVTGAKLAVSAVSTPNIADKAVTTAKIDDNAVTPAQLQNGSVSNDKLALNAISTDKLQDGSVAEANLANGAVTTNKIGTGAVSTGTLADNAVTTVKMADNQITTPKIQDAQITTPKLADANVTTPKVADAAITAPKMSGAQTGTAPVFGFRAWATCSGTTLASLTGTYVATGTTTITVTVTGHNHVVGDYVYLDFTTGTATDNWFPVAAVVDANNFTVTYSGVLTTSGAVTLPRHTIKASGNVSTVPWDNTYTGRVVINFITPMPNANYAVVGGTMGSQKGSGAGILNVEASAATSGWVGAPDVKTVQAVKVTVSNSTNGVGANTSDWYVAILG